MKKAFLGEFEKRVLLTTAIHNNEAYGVSLANEFNLLTGRWVSTVAIHISLHRLLDKSFVNSHMGDATASRGG